MAIETNQVFSKITSLSQTATDKIVEFLSNQGIEASQRFGSYLLLFITIGIFYLSLKITQPILKWVLIGIGALLIAGLLNPNW